MTGFRTDLAKFADLWRSAGLRAAVQGARARLLSPVYSWYNRRLDRVHGLDTQARVLLADLPIPAAQKGDYHEDQRYEAVPVHTFRRMMSALPADPSDYIFLDFGSGKGRAAILASHYQFKKIIGVELSPELHNIALRNQGRLEFLSDVDSRVELVNMNAIDYVVPSEQAVFYFYNPFPESVMSHVLRNIEQSYRMAPRKCYFIYVNPQCAHLFERMNFIRLVKRRRFASMNGAIYETIR